MARFRIGQRVRIKWSRAFPYIAGKQGKIVGLVNRSNPHDLDCEWRVIPDGYSSSLLPLTGSPTGFSHFCPSSNQLEPLTDSNELVSWESMRDLWVPEHLRIEA